MKAVIFDMDGVIIDSEPVHIRLERRIFEELGLHLGPGEHESFLGTNSRRMFSLLKERYGIDRSVDELVTEERRRYMEMLRSMELPVIPGIPELTNALSTAGFSLAVASSAPHEQIDLVMERSGLAGLFAVRISGDDVENSKPDPAVFLRAAAGLDCPPEDCWVIEDAEHGITAARRAGMKCIAFANPGSGSQDLSAADHLIRRIPEATPLIIGN